MGMVAMQMAMSLLTAATAFVAAVIALVKAIRSKK